MKLFVTQCAAWAPGLETPADWADWAENRRTVEPEGTPLARAVPAMTRRRLTRWGRLALEVATALDGHLSARAPVIFSSRHGDTQRTEQLLRNLALEEPLSPTAFSLSVHNAALGIFTIIRQITAPSLAVAAGHDTFAHAWLEAQTWLHQGAPQVLLVHADEPLSAFYKEDADEMEMPASVALLLSTEPSVGARGVSLSRRGLSGTRGSESMMMQFLGWWFGREARLECNGDRLTWTWEKDLEVA